MGVPKAAVLPRSGSCAHSFALGVRTALRKLSLIGLALLLLNLDIVEGKQITVLSIQVLDLPCLVVIFVLVGKRMDEVLLRYIIFSQPSKEMLCLLKFDHSVPDDLELRTCASLLSLRGDLVLEKVKRIAERLEFHLFRIAGPAVS